MSRASHLILMLESTGPTVTPPSDLALTGGVAAVDSEDSFDDDDFDGFVDDDDEHEAERSSLCINLQEGSLLNGWHPNAVVSEAEKEKVSLLIGSRSHALHTGQLIAFCAHSNAGP